MRHVHLLYLCEAVLLLIVSPANVPIKFVARTCLTADPRFA
jgi:hypothetical protein